jgi:CBS domain-containing protein
MQLKEIMSPRVQTIDVDATVREAAQMMARSNVGFLPVLKENIAVGVVTDRDITVRAVAGQHDPQTTRVAEIMTVGVPKPEHVGSVTQGIDSLPEDADAAEALELMQQDHVHRILVHNGDYELAGVVSLTDLEKRYLLPRMAEGGRV